MNEEYLWDKTGGDAEIEGLENVLAVFRYTPDSPPALPAKVLSFAEPRGGNWFKLGFAVAFAAAVIAIVPGVWFLVPNRSVVIGNETAKAVDPVPVVNQQNVDAVRVQSQPVVTTPRSSDRPAIRAAGKTFKTVAVNPKAASHPVKLSEEEKYAYGQLMLALSITGSKLKIVRDAIAGDEEIKPALQKGKDVYQK